MGYSPRPIGYPSMFLATCAKTASILAISTVSQTATLSTVPYKIAPISGRNRHQRHHGISFRHSTRERRVITSSGPLVIAQSNKTKCLRRYPKSNLQAKAFLHHPETGARNWDRKYVGCPYITIRKSPSGLLSGSSARTARSMVASFPFLCIASPNK